MSIISAISPCWCPVNLTLSQRERGCPFRQKSHHLLPKPKSAPPLRPRRPPAALGAPPSGPARSQDLHGRRCWGGWPREADEREMIFIGRQDLGISVEAFSFSLAPRQSVASAARLPRGFEGLALFGVVQARIIVSQRPRRLDIQRGEDR